MKAKGKVISMTGDGFEVRTERVYALCPKYIQARTWELGRRDRPARDTERAPTLTGEQGEWISRADTFFVASFHPETAADASHRGGMPGFVRVVDGGTLVWPDYPGNRMFNTLGNLTANPKAGLLFVDFESGDTLQLTGETRLEWDKEEAARFAGAERTVEFRVGEVLATPGASPLKWRLQGYSPFNPP